MQRNNRLWPMSLLLPPLDAETAILSTTTAESSSRNPLEQPWTLTPEEFTKRAHKHGALDLRLFTTVRDETAALTEAIAKVEREIDGRVAGLYGL